MEFGVLFLEGIGVLLHIHTYSLVQYKSILKWRLERRYSEQESTIT